MSFHTNIDPIDVLLAEHETATARLDAFRSALTRVLAGGSGQAEALAEVCSLLPFLDHDVEIHIRKEDALFARLTAAMPAPNPLMEEMAGEHEQVRLRREKLRAVLGSADPRIQAVVHPPAAPVAMVPAAAGGTVAGLDRAELRKAGLGLLRTLRTHFRNEERVVFPLARQWLSAAELSAVAYEFIRQSTEPRVP